MVTVTEKVLESTRESEKELLGELGATRLHTPLTHRL